MRAMPIGDLVLLGKGIELILLGKGLPKIIIVTINLRHLCYMRFA